MVKGNLFLIWTRMSYVNDLFSYLKWMQSFNTGCRSQCKWANRSEAFTSFQGCPLKKIISPTCTYRDASTCLHAHTSKNTYCKHTYIKNMKVLWQQGTKGWVHAGGGGRRRKACLYGFLWVWWSWWTDNTGHMKHKDSEEMLSGVTLLEVYSHIHTVMKEKSKKR